MSKAQLLDLIKSKGSSRKQALFEITRAQTEDWAKSQNANISIDEEIARLTRERDAFRAEVAQKRAAADAERNHIQKLRADAAEKQAELEAERKADAKSTNFKNGCRAIEQTVSKQLVQKINKILENDSPAELVAALELFVALLRNKRNTKPVDVELFFQDHGKLVAKMARTETTSCSMSLIMESLEKLQTLRTQFGAPAADAAYDLSEFVCFVEWSFSFCQASQIDLRVSELEAQHEKMLLDLERAQLALSRYDQIFQQIEQHQYDEFFNREIANLERRKTIFNGITTIDLDQATKYQKAYKKFEDNYFAEYLRIVQEM